MSTTIAVLALDAADEVLIERYNCESLKYRHHGHIESFAIEFDYPMTWEVWPAIAVGKHPDDFEDVEIEWDSIVLQAGQKITKFMPMRWRARLGKSFRDNHASGFKEPKENTCFDYNLGWPGASNASDLRDSWSLMEQAAEGTMTKEELFERNCMMFGKQLGWLKEAAKTGAPVVGVHSHILDVAGHTYHNDDEEMERYYNKVNEMINDYLDGIDRLVILSDHGMQMKFLGDDEPGTHSWRAYGTTNMSQPLPDDILDMNYWLNHHKIERTIDDESLERDEETVQNLRDLGYIE